MPMHPDQDVLDPELQADRDRLKAIVTFSGQEIVRLKAISAELLAALEAALTIRPNRRDLWVPAARAAIAKARAS